MIEDFEIDWLFEDQVHERPQFKVIIEGKDYQGLIKDGEINWLHPHPERNLNDELVEKIEKRIHVLMKEHLH